MAVSGSRQADEAGAEEEEPDYGRPLPYGAPALLPLGPDETPPNVGGAFIDREQLIPALERSLSWTRTEHAAQCGEVRRLVEAVGGDQMQIVHARALDVHVNLFRVFL